MGCAAGVLLVVRASAAAVDGTTGVAAMDEADVPCEVGWLVCTALGAEARLFFMKARHARAGCFFTPSRQGVRHFSNVFSMAFSCDAISACGHRTPCHAQLLATPGRDAQHRSAARGDSIDAPLTRVYKEREGVVGAALVCRMQTLSNFARKKPAIALSLHQ